MEQNAIMQAILELSKQLKGTETRLTNRLNTLEGRMSSMETRMDSIETRMDSIENRMGSLETRIDSIENRMDSLEKKIVSVEKTFITKIGTTEKMLDKKITKIDTKFSILSDELLSTRADVKMLKEGKQNHFY